MHIIRIITKIGLVAGCIVLLIGAWLIVAAPDRPEE